MRMRKNTKHSTMSEKPKNIHIHPKHAKPIRRSHIISLSIFLLIGASLVVYGVRYLADLYNKQLSANISAQNDADIKTNNQKTAALNSSLGFSFTFDPQLFSVTATEILNDGSTKTYDTKNVSETRAYAAAQFVPVTRSGSDNAATYDRSSMAVLAPKDTVNDNEDKTLHDVAKEYADKSDSDFNVIFSGETTQTLGGIKFIKQSYLNTPRYKSKGGIKFEASQSYVWAGVLDNHKPLIIKVSAIATGISPLSAYNKVISTFSATAVVSQSGGLSPNQMALVTQSPQVLSWIDRFNLFGQQVNAASSTAVDNSRTVAAYTPAVVKVYHVTCGSISYRGVPVLADGCDGASGTGFFVSSDGVIGTNGHVVSISAKDILSQAIDPDTFARMLQIDGYSYEEIVAIMDELLSSQYGQAAAQAAILKLSDQDLKYQDQKDFYIVSLGTESPDFSVIIKNRKFDDTTTIKNASLIGTDYDFNDQINIAEGKGFTHSDVALLKVSGNNYPITRLGTISGLAQGSALTVIGYPGVSEGNGLTKDDKLQVTITNGVVSAVRDSNGGGKKIIQSDAKISHGNSGGPAFSQSGEVIGVATYALSGTQSGDADYSYMRDIQDLKDLAKGKSVTIDTNSATQKTWEAGLDEYFKAHYTKAIKQFGKVKDLYKPHTLVAQYIATAQDKISKGEEVKDSKALIFIIAGGVVVVMGVVGTTILIIRHHGKHQVYKVAAGGYKAVPSGFTPPPAASQTSHK